jgi:predicted alpha/beta superfamily hydrolase
LIALDACRNWIAVSLFLLQLLAGQQCFAQELIKTTPFTIGETVEFRSQVLDEKRVLNVYLPQSYNKTRDNQYPIIYLLDGSSDEDFIHIVGLVQFGSFAWIKMLPESIVVGIVNVDRKRDFTTLSENEQDKKDFPTTGGSSRFIEMLETEIQPLVKKQYRNNGEETLIGQSLGGLLATEILFTKPDLFDNYIIVSPSLWWNERSLLNAKPANLPNGTSIFVGVGKEGEVMEHVANELHRKIKNIKPDSVRLYFEYFPELDHGDTLHLAVYKAFQEMFGTEKR